jgi:hypothetical protein
MDERIEVADKQVKLIARGRTLDSASAGEMCKLVWASPADSLFHGEESYYVAFLSDRVWVVPYFTIGIRGFLETVGPVLAKQEALFRAEISACPVPWRRRVFGLVPLFPTPALGTHPVRTVPDLLGVKLATLDEIKEGGAPDA